MAEFEQNSRMEALRSLIEREPAPAELRDLPVRRGESEGLRFAGLSEAREQARVPAAMQAKDEKKEKPVLSREGKELESKLSGPTWDVKHLELFSEDLKKNGAYLTGAQRLGNPPSLEFRLRGGERSLWVRDASAEDLAKAGIGVSK